jgi:metal-sulfur cluster biosynthetic enzyme
MAMDGRERKFPEAAEGDAGADGDLEDRILDSLKNVIDPELGINIVDLGLVYEVRVEGDTVHIEYSLTTMGCPIGPMIEAQMRELLNDVEGVDNLEAELVFSPPWTPDKMSEEAKAALGVF